MRSMLARFQRLLMLSAAVVVAACGGGGGGGGDDSPGGGSQQGGFTISPGSVEFASKLNGPPASSRRIAVHLTDTSASKLTAGYRDNVTPPGWLDIAASGSGFDYEFALSVRSTGLSAGTYSTTLTIGTSDSSNRTLQTKDVQVTYSLREGVTITSSPPLVTATNGSSEQSTQTRRFTVASPASIQWSAASNVPWLIAPAGTQQGAGVFDLTVNLSTLAPGPHLGQLTLTGAFGNAAALTISDEGRLLFVVDDSASDDPVVRVLDPVSGALLTTYQMTLPDFTTSQEHVLQYARPDGREILLSAGISLDAFDVDLGYRYLAVLEGPAIAVSSDQGHVYTQNTGFSPSTITAYRLRYSTVGGVGVLVSSLATNRGEPNNRGNGQDVAVSADGARVYVASGGSDRFDILDAATLEYSASLSAQRSVNSLRTCWNGLIAGGADVGAEPDDDIWIYNASGTLRDRLDSGAGTLAKRSLTFSGDGTRVISAGASGLRIQTAPVP